MSTPALQSEHIARAVRAAQVAHLPAALTAVADSWQEVAPLNLPAPRSFGWGFRDTIQAMHADQFPHIGVLAAPVSPNTTDSDQGWAEATHGVVLGCVVLAPDSDTAMVLAWRYTQAIAQVMIEHAPYAGFDLVSVVPRTSEGQPVPHRPGGQAAGYTCGRVLQYDVRGSYSP